LEELEEPELVKTPELLLVRIGLFESLVDPVEDFDCSHVIEFELDPIDVVDCFRVIEMLFV